MLCEVCICVHLYVLVTPLYNDLTRKMNNVTDSSRAQPDEAELLQPAAVHVERRVKPIPLPAKQVDVAAIVKLAIAKKSFHYCKHKP